MQASELIQMAALVAAHSPTLIRGDARLSADSVEQYWTASKCRLDRWARSLKHYSAQTQKSEPADRDAHWWAVIPVLQEIFTSEVLTRVWTGVACAHDRRRGTDEVEPVARSVLIGHMEARHRSLHLMVARRRTGHQQTAALDWLRRRTERWSDMLLGHVIETSDVSEFAVDPERAREFASDLRHERLADVRRYAWPLMLASLGSALPKALRADGPNADLNSRITASILVCFQPELFDSTGVLNCLWQMRLTNTATDTQGMLEELLADDPSPPDPRRAGFLRCDDFPRDDRMRGV